MTQNGLKELIQLELTKEKWEINRKEFGLIRTIEIFDAAMAAGYKGITNPAYSFAHIVIDDYNLSDYHIKWCLEQKQVDDFLDLEIERNKPNQARLTMYVYHVVLFLKWLLTIPECDREKAEDEYWGEDDQ